MKVIIGNLFQSKAQTLVNTVTSQEISERGLALEFKKRFPEMHEDYVRRVHRREVAVGEPFLYRYLVAWILNFPVKNRLDSAPRVEDVIRGLEFLEQNYRDWGITSLGVPPVGCGRGQFQWRVIGPVLYRHLNRLEIPVELFAPYGTPEEEIVPEVLERMSRELETTGVQENARPESS